MRIRLVGFALILIGALFAVFFVYLPLQDGGEAFVGGVRIKAIVFVPFAVVIGLVLLVGGEAAYRAFQVGPKTKAQTSLVLSSIVVAGVLSGVMYWQIKSRWLTEPAPIILGPPIPPPTVPNMQPPAIPALPQPSGRD